MGTFPRIEAGVVLAACWLGVTACKRPHSHDVPDAAATTTPRDEWMEESLPCPINQQDEEAEMPRGACVPGQQSCNIGRECCCGRCAPNVVCECIDGEWGCYHTDFCFAFSCDEGGAPQGETAADGGWSLGR